MNYLLDTCVVSELIKPKPNSQVIAWVEAVPEDRLHLSVLTLGELQKGIAKLGKNSKSHRLQQWLDVEVRSRFAERMLGLDEETLLCWGQITGEAEKKGNPLPVIDSLLAATAKVHHLILVTRNTADFKGMEIEVFDPWTDN